MPSLAEALAPLVDESGHVRDDVSSAVEIRNTSNDPFKMAWNSVDYTVLANSSRNVPYYCMVSYFGDPRAFDVPGDERRRHRTDEWARIRTRYGIYDNTSDPSAMANLPRWMEVYNLAGTRIITVVDDWEGNSVSDLGVAKSRQEHLEQSLSQLQEQMNRLLAERDNKDAAKTATLNDSEQDQHRRTDQPTDVSEKQTSSDAPITTAEDLTKNIKPTKPSKGVK